MEINIRNTKYLGLCLGIVGMIALATLLPEENTRRISGLTENNSGERAVLNGIIRGLEIRKGNAFFELENEGTIKAVYFKPSAEQMAMLRENSAIKASGSISLYKSDIELVVREVKKID